MNIHELIHELATMGQKHGRDAVVMVSFISDPPEIAHITRVASGRAFDMPDTPDGKPLIFLDAERAPLEQDK